MALQTQILKTAIQQAFIRAFTQPDFNENNAHKIAQELGDDIGAAVDAFVKTGNAVGTDSRGDSHNLTIQ